MPVTESQNFAFLKDLGESNALYGLCAEAETLSLDRPVESLAAVRNAATVLANWVARESESALTDEGLVETLKFIEAENLVIPHIANRFHEIRRVADDAAESSEATSEDAKAAVVNLHILASWYAKVFHDIESPEFVENPENKTGAIETGQGGAESTPAQTENAIKNVDVSKYPEPESGGERVPYAERVKAVEASIGWVRNRVDRHEHSMVMDSLDNAQGKVHLPVASQILMDSMELPEGQQPVRPEVQSGLSVPMAFAAKYRVLSLIGRGGMGRVFRAERREDGKLVAAKVLHGDLPQSQTLQRFLREAQSIQRLEHPGIVGFYEFFEDDSAPVLVMEFIDGEGLDVKLKNDGQLREMQAVRVFEAVCSAVAYAHSRGVIHRDLKPSNVVMDRAGAPRVLDFGLARGVDGTELSMTGYGMGTMDYAAPEQKLDAKNVDERADIYSLGLLFYVMLSGRRPVPLHVRKVPARWRRVIEIACDDRRDGRFSSVDEMLAAIATAKDAADAPDLDCPECGTTNTMDARMCFSCGHSLLATCVACGADFRFGIPRCDKCGALQTAPELPTAEEVERALTSEELVAMEAQFEKAKRLEEVGNISVAASVMRRLAAKYPAYQPEVDRLSAVLASKLKKDHDEHVDGSGMFAVGMIVIFGFIVVVIFLLSSLID